MRHRGGGNVRLYGPYRHRDRWRVVRRERGKEDAVFSYDSEEKARAVIAEFKAITEGRTVTQALDAFLAHLRSIPRAPNTVTATSVALRRILGPGRDETMLADITPRRAQALYDKLRADGAKAAAAGKRGGSIASQHACLERAKAWGVWLASQGWVKANPFEAVARVGTAERGKKQLRLVEARLLVDSCLARGDRASVAVLCYLLLGMRQGEVRGLIGRDVDDDGRIVWIERGKTRAARRHLEVPDALAVLLAALAKEAGALGRILPGSKEWARRQTALACDRAGVPRVTPHGLRGSHSTFAVRGGSSSAMVMVALEEAARSMGHASTSITASTYVQPGATDSAAARSVFRVISGGRG